MNLTESIIDYEKYNILSYKKYQQGLIKYFFDLTLKYLKTNGFKYDNYEQIWSNKTMYKGFCYSDLYNLKIMIDGCEYYNLDIPKLTNNFYTLNGAKYIPSIYIVDYPIIYKKNKTISINIYSIFNPIDILFCSGVVKLFSHTIPINRFLSLYYDDAEHKKICEITKIKFKKYNTDDNIIWFKREYLIPNNMDLFDKFNNLFMDDFTKNLYNSCYDENISTLKDILNIVLTMIINNKKISFIDLKNKRLIFAEALLQPVFKATQQFIKLMENKTLIAGSNIKSNAILKWFNVGLERNFQYLEASPITVINTLKSSFKSPISNMSIDKIPSEISNIHSSFYGKICTVSVSAKNTGVVCHLIPEQSINLLTGQFLI